MDEKKFGILSHPFSKFRRRDLLKQAGTLSIAGATLGATGTLRPFSGGGTLTTAVWVHGNALIAENPDDIGFIQHRGLGADVYVKMGRSIWFHVPMPTPVIVDATRPKLARVFIFYWITLGGIYQVDLYDGVSKIKEFSGLNLTGDHRTAPEGANTFELGAPQEIRYGLGISILTSFYQCLDGSCPPQLAFSVAAAGADFVIL
jgi:hypothetical protein